MKGLILGAIASCLTAFSSEVFVGKTGNEFVLEWKDPAGLSEDNLTELEEMFVRSFLVSYRSDQAFEDKSDEEVTLILKKYFSDSMVPHFKVDGVLYVEARNKNILAAYTLFEKMSETEIYVAELGVNPDFWFQGLGAKLMNIIVQKEPQTKKIVLLTEWVNIRAQKFYEALGYRPSNYMHPGYDPSQFRAYEMELSQEIN